MRSLCSKRPAPFLLVRATRDKRSVMVGGYTVDAPRTHYSRDLLFQTPVPTLVICGTTDKSSPIEHYWLLASRLPDAELLIMLTNAIPRVVQ